MRFAEPRGAAEEDRVDLLLDEAEVEEVLDLRPVDLLRPAPLELIERLGEREASEPDTALQAAVIALGDLRLDEALEVLDVVPLLLSGGLRELVVVAADVGELQPHEELRERLERLAVGVRGGGVVVVTHRLWPRRWTGQVRGDRARGDLRGG